MTNKYELVVIVNAALSDDEKEKILKQATDAIAKAGGKVINSQVWLEKQKLAFQINKSTEGVYYLINFEGESVVNEKLKDILKLNESILRHLIIKLKD